MRISPVEANYNIHNQNQLAYKGKSFKKGLSSVTEGPIAKVCFLSALTTAVSNFFPQRASKELNPKSFEEQKEELFTKFGTEAREDFDTIKQNPKYWNFLKIDIDEVPYKEDLKRYTQLIKEAPETLNKTLKALNEYGYCFPGNKIAQCNLPGLLRCAEFMKNSPKQTEKLLEDVAPKYVGGEKPCFKTLDAFLGFIAGLIIELDTKAKSYYPSKEEQQNAYSSLASVTYNCYKPPIDVVFNRQLLESESCAYYATYMVELLQYEDIRQLVYKNKDLIFELIKDGRIFDTKGIDLISKFSYDYYNELLWRTCG